MPTDFKLPRPKAVKQNRRLRYKGALVTNKLDVLLATREEFKVEERWLKNNWFENQDPNQDPEDPWCDGWATCLGGMVASLTIGMARSLSHVGTERDDATDEITGYRVCLVKEHTGVDWNLIYDVDVQQNSPDGSPWYDFVGDPQDWDLYKETNETLVAVANEMYGHDFDSVPEFNDSAMTTRSEVMRVVNKAISETLNEEG